MLRKFKLGPRTLIGDRNIISIGSYNLSKPHLRLIRNVKDSIPALLIGHLISIKNRFLFFFGKGPDGELLLEAIRQYASHDAMEALRILDHPVIVRNCSSVGGSNPMRMALIDKWDAS